jgi:hypothetical protein
MIIIDYLFYFNYLCFYDFNNFNEIIKSETSFDIFFRPKEKKRTIIIIINNIDVYDF